MARPWVRGDEAIVATALHPVNPVIR